MKKCAQVLYHIYLMGSGFEENFFGVSNQIIRLANLLMIMMRLEQRERERERKRKREKVN